MNFNDYPKELKIEEQKVLNRLISKMNQVLYHLDQQMQVYVREARDTKISDNPDLYLSVLLSQNGIKDTEENRIKFLQARDELYNTRLLLHYEDKYSTGVEEIKIGLHACGYGAEQYIISWKMPLCRHYIFNNTSTEFESVVKGKYGEEHHTHYRLLVKNDVKLKFTRVKEVVNIFPGIFDKDMMQMLKKRGFFSDAFLDKMIESFDPDTYDPDSAAKIISDEFLQELLERRSTPEFKNIVFSIQKKQGEIIQAPYQKHMVVQGCAGSGKSMIMLHRLPILLYDNPTSINRMNLYVITPSPMYIQLAENMRHQLEISDIGMGTIEQYYDYCISKYPGRKAGDYGKMNGGARLSIENELYVYSKQCIEDIRGVFEELCLDNRVSLEKAYTILTLKESNSKRPENTYAQKISSRLVKIQNILSANNEVLSKYFREIRNILDALSTVSFTLKHRKDDVLKEIAKRIAKNEAEINLSEIEIKKLNPDKNVDAIQNRRNIIDIAQQRIEELEEKRAVVEADTEYFSSLLALNLKFEALQEPFKGFNRVFSQNMENAVYEAIDKIGQLIGGYFMLAWELSRIEDKYEIYLGSISKEVQKASHCISALQETTDKYLNIDYYSEIREERDFLTDYSAHAIKNVYEQIMGKIGVKRTEKGNLSAVRCSPYLYLQVLYQYQGPPNANAESLLAIDEAQGIAPEEIRLLKNVNNSKVVFNMYGDIYQHIEGTKGIDSWDELDKILDFDVYEMQENYRNALQITNFCNQRFNMNMVAINTSGKGVHEIKSDLEFQTEMLTQLLDSQRVGLAAILVGDDAEARYLLDRFSKYAQKFHDMTDEDFSVHHTRWNIINIDDAKGLEFSSVIALSGRMSRNQKYIAYTRALDHLYVYESILDVTGFEKKKDLGIDVSKNKPVASDISAEEVKEKGEKLVVKHVGNKSSKDYFDSEVRKFFENRGHEVVDQRDQGGRLWVLGEKTSIRSDVNAATHKFNISGKYATNKDLKNRSGWCTKTDK